MPRSRLISKGNLGRDKALVNHGASYYTNSILQHDTDCALSGFDDDIFHRDKPAVLTCSMTSPSDMEPLPQNG
jgi:hypothetical protein